MPVKCLRLPGDMPQSTNTLTNATAAAVEADASLELFKNIAYISHNGYNRWNDFFFAATLARSRFTVVCMDRRIYC